MFWISKLQHSQISKLLRFSMADVLAAEAAVLAQLQALAGLLLVLGRAVIPALTLGARQGDYVSHGL
jgi:fatty acid desaturase